MGWFGVWTLETFLVLHLAKETRVRSRENQTKDMFGTTLSF
jgi:hypothetical protein